jgi:flagellar biosynthesis protein FlhF
MRQGLSQQGSSQQNNSQGPQGQKAPSRNPAVRDSAAQPTLKLKTYRAWTMAEALATVKSDLGSDAVILHTRTFERGGIFGIGRRTVVELTAARAADMPAEPSSNERSPADLPRATARAAAIEPKQSLQMSAAARAYGSQPAPAAQNGSDEPGFDLEVDREKTRRLAQAMAIQLEKQASARESASQNERATTQFGASASAPLSVPAPAAATPNAAPASRVPSHPLPTVESVAQRFVLVAQPAAPGVKSGLVTQLATAVPKAATQPAVTPAITPVITPRIAAQTVQPVAAAPADSAAVVAARPTDAPASRDAQVGMPAFVPMEFMHPEPLPEKPAAKAPEAPAPLLGAASAAFVSPISIEPWCDRASEPEIAAAGVERTTIDATIDAVLAPVPQFDVGMDVASDVDAQIEIRSSALATPAISIAAPSSSADAVSRAQPRGDDELSAISDFVGRVLEGRVLEGRVLEGRVLEGRVLEGRAAAAVSIETKPFPAVEPAARPEPATRPEPAARSEPATRPEPAARAEVLERAYARLIEQEVAADLAERIVGSVAAEMQAAIDAGAEPSERVVRAAIERRIAALLPADAEDGLGGSSSRMLPGKFGARRIAFIGPTGVGKTTTLAKVAAQLKLKRGLSVGIVAADTYRIAAVDQLRTYAEILEVPVEVAASPFDAERACERLAREHGVDVILIDTAGRSQNDRMKLSELRAFLVAARPDETHLVLSATASARTLEREAAAFGAVGIDRIVLTKLDEAATFGTLISLVERLGKRVSFLTHGQEVPDHIEPGRGHRLAELVMGSEVR